MEITETSDAFHIVARGEWTIYSASETMQAIRQHLTSAKPLLLDLSQLNEIDSAGMQILLLLAKRQEQLQQSFSITALSTAASEAFNLLSVQLPGART
jgi:anti-anti-sigma factor